MTECLVCTGKAELFICQQCISVLRANLTKLAQGPEVNGRNTNGLLDALADVVLKYTRMGSGGGHRKRGDELPALFIPDVGKMGKDNKPILSPQGWAAELLDDAHNKLTTIVRDICETRGVPIMVAFRVVPADFIGPLLPGQKRAVGEWNPTDAEQATWLAQHAHTIACYESAGQWWAQIDTLVRQIERAIDRPVRFELLGMCTTQLDEGEMCDTALRAPEDAIEVRCPKCRTVRRCDIVRRMSQNDARKALIPWSKVLETNKGQPDGWKVSDRTLRDWRSTGVLRPRQYLRPGGGHGYNPRSDDDEPLYAWSDIERLRSQGVPKGHRKRIRAGR